MSTQTDPEPKALTLEEISKALTPAMLKELASRADLALVPHTVYRASTDTMLVKTVRPPTKKMLGTKLRVTKPFPITEKVLQELFATSEGLPESTEGDFPIKRDQASRLLPKKETSTHDTYHVKLQDPEHVAGAMRLQKRAPKRGHGAAKLILAAGKERRGERAQKVSMAAMPFVLKGRIPKGSTARKQQGRAFMKMNVITLDFNGNVTFGSKTDSYHYTVKQRLRAEIFRSACEMGYKGLPIDPALFETARDRLTNVALCGPHAATLQPLPPPPPPPPPPGAAPPPPPPASKSFEIESIVEEHGPWGGEHRKWYLVRWAGYHPSWEAWRIRGAPGTPVEMWEPLVRVARTAALQAWKAAQQPQA